MRRKTYTFEITLPDGPTGRRALLALPIGMMAGGVGLGVWTLHQATGFSLVQFAAGAAAVAATYGAAVLIIWLRRRRSPILPVLQRGASVQTFDSFTAAVTPRLAQLIIQHGIHCNVAIHRGPFSVTFQLSVTRDFKDGLTKLMSLQNAIAAVARNRVRMVQDPKGVLCEIQLPKHLHTTPNAVRLVNYTRWPEIPVGLNQYMNVVAINPEHHGCLAWISPPRRGKTQSMKSMLYLMLQADPTLQFMVCALGAKIQKDWGVFGMVHGCLGLVGDPAEMSKALQWVVAQMHAGSLDTRLVVVLDDVANIAGDVAGLGKCVDAIGLAGAGLGVHMMLGTHSNGSRAAIGGTLIMAAETCKIMFKAADSTQGARSAGRKNAETGLNELSGSPGDAILDEDGSVSRIATAWVNDSDILTLGPAYPGFVQRPWMVSASPSPRVTNGRHPIGASVTSGRETWSPSSPVSPAYRASHTTSPTWPPREPPVGDVVTGDGDAVTGYDPIDDVPAGMFPVGHGGALNDKQAYWLQWLQSEWPEKYNPTQLTKIAYGEKSTRRLNHVREALSRTVAAPEDEPGGAMSKELAIAILESDDVNDPRRSAALAFLSDEVTIDGHQWDDAGYFRRKRK